MMDGMASKSLHGKIRNVGAVRDLESRIAVMFKLRGTRMRRDGERLESCLMRYMAKVENSSQAEAKRRARNACDRPQFSHRCASAVFTVSTNARLLIVRQL